MTTVTNHHKLSSHNKGSVYDQNKNQNVLKIKSYKVIVFNIYTLKISRQSNASITKKKVFFISINAFGVYKQTSQNK